MSPTEKTDTRPDCDAAVIGAGFAGLYAVHKLAGLGFAVQGFERAQDVGGVWFWNRYPGARCDIESMQYSYSFSDELQQDWRWSETYAGQPEILRYMNHVADRFDLRWRFRFGVSVVSATFDEARSWWRIETDDGAVTTARHCILATGPLSAAKTPDIEGLSSFAGETYYTSAWPHEGASFAGKRVAVIGTGSSGVQAVPMIAEEADQLVVFQRTPNYSLPSRNGAMTDEYERHWKSDYPAHRAEARRRPTGTIHDSGALSAIEVSDEERRLEYEDRWRIGGTRFLRAYKDLGRDERANETAAAFVREKIGAIVADPWTREALTPRDYPIGAKRPCVDTGYFEAFNRPNVRLVDVRQTPIRRITPEGIATSAEQFAFDAVVFATGFDAMTGSILRIAITGRGGETLQEKWAAGPRTNLGLMSAGFPNLFFITGPGSPSVLCNMVVASEQHVDWIADCLVALRDAGKQVIEADPDAEERWVEHVNEAASKTLFLRANSWFLGANVPGKPRVFMPYPGGADAYRRTCDEVAASGYPGFTISAADAPAELAEAR